MKEKKAVIVLFAIIMFTGILFCVQKKDFFIDEMCSYGLANSYYNPFLRTIYDHDLMDCVVEGKDLWNYLTVGNDDGFKYDSVVYNQSLDVHPPLYYMMLHTVCSFFPNTFSKWYGLVPNIIMWGVTLWFLYALGTKLFKDSRMGMLLMALYGLSNTSVSNMTLIRMYMALTMLSVMLAYCFLIILEKQNWKCYLSVFIVIFFGMLNHYFFGIYAFLGCLGIVFYLIGQKKIKEMLQFGFSALFGVIAAIAVYPTAIRIVTNEEKLSTSYSLSRILESIVKNIVDAGRGLFVAAICAVIAIIILIIRRGYLKKENIDCVIVLNAIRLLVPSFIAVLIITIIAPVYRYIYQLTPFIVLFVVFLCWLAINALQENVFVQKYNAQIQRIVFGLGTLVLIFVTVFIFNPNYQYLNQAKGCEVASMYKTSPCLYLNVDDSDDTDADMISNLYQLKDFTDICVYCDPTNEFVTNYILNHQDNDHIVVYIAYDDMSVDTQMMDNLVRSLSEKYSWEQIQVGDFSRMYLVSR